MGKVKGLVDERPGAAALEAEIQRRAAKAATTPFDPRTEVSADAKYIVRNLVLWFLVLPVLVGVLVWGISNSVK